MIIYLDFWKNLKKIHKKNGLFLDLEEINF